ncbi:hypothetical protein [Halomarina pelagica]|uniref:hypothetical protein n=1 Tax=Halomarina pelagica TaxID=2961599 RepID=UPI0020C4C644|nr:hypothetical protein [Halomarina sp. BND7]
MARDRDLPPILAVGDVLDRIERESDADVSDEIGDLRDALDRLAEREEVGRASVLDDVDERLLALRERLSGDADWYAQAIENRIRQYRDASAAASETLSVSAPRLERDGSELDVSRAVATTAHLRGMLVNRGEASDAVVVLTFYAPDGATVRTVETRAYRLEAGAQRDLDETVYVPEEADYYAVAVLAPGDPRTVGGETNEAGEGDRPTEAQADRSPDAGDGEESEKERSADGREEADRTATVE